MDHAVHAVVEDLQLVALNGGGVPGFEIGGVQLKDTEANVQRLGGVQLNLTIGFDELFAHAADAVLANLTDVFIICFVSLAALITNFRKLDKYELSVTCILRIEPHYSMRCGCGAGKEVENNIIIFCSDGYHSFN